MSDVAAFVRARLSEDEDAANDNGGAKWPDISRDQRFGYDDWRDEFGVVVVHDDSLSEDLVRHVARHDPARVLAQVAAMRAMVELHGVDETTWPKADGMKPYVERHCTECGKGEYPFGDRTENGRFEPTDWPCPTLRHLAAIWDWHDEYDPTWAVE